MAEEAMLGGMDDERRRLEQFRSWHDEAFLYINQVGQLVATLSSRKNTKTYWRMVGKRSPDPHQAVTQEADDTQCVKGGGSEKCFFPRKPKVCFGQLGQVIECSTLRSTFQ